MRRFWAWMAVTFGRRAPIVGAVVLAVTVVLGAGATRLDFATGQDSYLNPDEQVYVDNVEYQSLFGGQAMLTLFTMGGGSTVADLFTPQNVDRFERVEAALESEAGVLAVVTPLTALEFTQNLVTLTPAGAPASDPTQTVAGGILLGALGREAEGSSQQQARLADAGRTAERLAEVPAEERTFDNRAWVEFLLFDNRGEIRKALRPFFPDESHAQLVTRLVGNASIEDEGLASDAVVRIMGAEDFAHADQLTTGAPVLLGDINDYLRGGFLSLSALAVGLMALILVFTFRVRWRLLSLAVVLVGIAWAFGLAGYLGIPLSVVTISGLPVLLGIGIDFAIQMHSRVEEEVQLDRAAHPIQETTTNLAPPLVVATLAAAIAFVCLQIAQVPMIRDFGKLLAVGILVVFVADVALSTTVLGAREHYSRTPPGDYTRDIFARTVMRLGSLPRAAVPVLLIASLAVLAGGAAVDGDLELETDPEEWVNQSSQVIHDLETLRAETGSSSELGLFVEAPDVLDDETVAFVHDFAYESLERYEGLLLTASSVVTTVSYLLEVPGATLLPPTGEDVRNAWAVAPSSIQRSTVAEGGRALNLAFRTGPSSLEERAVVVNGIRDEIDPPPGATATPSGLAVVGVGLLENLEANRVLLTYVALGAVFLFLAVRFLSIVKSLLCMVPVMMGVGGSSLLAWTAGFELSPLTALGGPLVIAACTEFTVLILTRYLEERRRGLGIGEASDVAAARTGRAFVASALATVAGVGVLASSSLPLLRDFGLITSLNVLIALLSALVVLPPLLRWVDERGWVRRPAFPR